MARDAHPLRCVDARVAVIRRTKVGKRRECILSPEMEIVLRSLPRYNDRAFRYTSRRWVYPQWQAACERAGIDYIRPHQAGRHSFATEMMVRHGVDPKTTAMLGGWDSIRQLDRYAHPEGLESVVDRVFATPKPKERKA